MSPTILSQKRQLRRQNARRRRATAAEYFRWRFAQDVLTMQRELAEQWDGAAAEKPAEPVKH